MVYITLFASCSSKPHLQVIHTKEASRGRVSPSRITIWQPGKVRPPPLVRLQWKKYHIQVCSSCGNLVRHSHSSLMLSLLLEDQEWQIKLNRQNKSYASLERLWMCYFFFSLKLTLLLVGRIIHLVIDHGKKLQRRWSAKWEAFLCSEAFVLGPHLLSEGGRAVPKSVKRESSRGKSPI